MDLTFITDYLVVELRRFRCLIYDAADELLYQVNIPEGLSLDSLKRSMSFANEPIVFNNVGHTVYWDESVRFSELKDVMQDLINSFISETVINSASGAGGHDRQHANRGDSLPACRFHRCCRSRKAAISARGMAGSNDPIRGGFAGRRAAITFIMRIRLSCTQLRYYPLAQLVLIAVFHLSLLTSFSAAFRRAEQDQVWVGMAKETAHQLGTPLSSLMAWVGLLEDQGVRKDYLEEMNRDIVRLNTVVDRFSKIGSKPDLKGAGTLLL
jgi:hypothetical protein